MGFYRGMAIAMSCVAIAVGTIVLVGWVHGINIFKNVHENWPTMKANTAAGFILLGICLLLRSLQMKWPHKDKFILVFSLLVLAVGAITTLEFLNPSETPFDHFLLGYFPTMNEPERMGFLVAINFILLSLATISLCFPKIPPTLSQVFCLSAFWISYLGILGFVYYQAPLLNLAGYSAMSVHSGILGVVLAIGLMALHPDLGVMKLFTQKATSGFLSKLLIPTVLIIPIFIGWLCLHWQLSGLMDPRMAITLFAIFTVIIFSAILLYCLYSVSDLDHQRQIFESEIQDRSHQLNIINKELESFSYSVSHDLRAPLRSIDGFSLALLEDCEKDLNEQGKQYLARIRKSAQVMARLIDDLLGLSRISRTPLQLIEVNLSDIAKDIMTDIREAQPQRHAEIKIQEGMTAKADYNLIRIALTNLLGNAWKYTCKTDVAMIEFGKTINHGIETYFVRDNGVGFDMAYSSQLFGAFQRLNPSTDFEGTGIGLTIVRRVITRHDGKTWAEAKPNEGATFYFTLQREEPS